MDEMMRAIILRYIRWSIVLRIHVESDAVGGTLIERE